jgi:hypothetical protein
MASLLLHGLFISGLARFSLSHPAREEKLLEIILDEPKQVSFREILPLASVPKRKVVKTQAESPRPAAISPKVELPEVLSPSAIIPSLKETAPLSRSGTLFLLDASESMVVGLDSAKQILKDRLDSLPEKIPVNIACFSNEVIFFSHELFMLTKEEKEKAQVFCENIAAKGNLEMTDGLKEILKRNPSRVILISDGLVEDRELAYRIIRKARSEGVIIDTILIQRNPFEDEVLKRAAYLTGGNFSISSQTF